MTGVAIRVLRADDADRLCRMFYRLSPDTIYRRFFTLYTDPPPRAIEALASVDHDSRDAMVACVGDEIVGVGRYATVAPGVAEVAVVVEDAWQGRGLGPRLLDCAVALARVHGVHTLVATVLAENAPAIAMLRRAFPDAEWTACGTEYELRVPLVAERIPA